MNASLGVDFFWWYRRIFRNEKLIWIVDFRAGQWCIWALNRSGTAVDDYPLARTNAIFGRRVRCAMHGCIDNACMIGRCHRGQGLVHWIIGSNDARLQVPCVCIVDAWPMLQNWLRHWRFELWLQRRYRFAFNNRFQFLLTRCILFILFR